MIYGILKSITNTGLDDQILTTFVAPLSIRSNQPEYIQDSMNLKRSSSSQGVQRWELEVNLEPTRNPVDLLLHNVTNGSAERFWVRMPQLENVVPTSSVVTVNGAFPKDTDSFNINGASSLVKGEFITFGNDTKVYVVKEAGAAGNTVRVHPKLRVALTNGLAIRTGGSVSMYARYDTDVMKGITYTDGVLVDNGTVVLVEAL